MSADLAEAQACRELLSGDEGLAASNKEITHGLHALVQQERAAEDTLRL